MIDDDPFAIRALHVCRDHATSTSGNHGSAQRRRPVYAGMETRYLKDRVRANAKARGEIHTFATRWFSRLQRRWVRRNDLTGRDQAERIEPGRGRQERATRDRGAI